MTKLPEQDDLRVCTDNSRRCLEMTAMLYLDALLLADDSKVPFAPDVQRTHTLANGRPAAEDRVVSGEAEIRASIRREKLLFRHGLRLFVDETLGQVIALFQTGTDFPGAGCCTVMDRLRIADGFIKEIEIISVPKAGTPEDTVG